MMTGLWATKMVSSSSVPNDRIVNPLPVASPHRPLESQSGRAVISSYAVSQLLRAAIIPGRPQVRYMNRHIRKSLSNLTMPVPGLRRGFSPSRNAVIRPDVRAIDLVCCSKALGCTWE